jgi:hypothetical protein
MTEHWRGVINTEHDGWKHRLAYEQLREVRVTGSGMVLLNAITRPPRPLFLGDTNPTTPLLIEDGIA